ncbi:MAG: DUF5723 family protein [Bacteroidota bacterium]
MRISFNKKILFAIIVLVTGWFSAKSQDGNPIQFLSSVSQSSFVNPAHQNKTEKLVVGIPFLSGTLFEWDSNIAFNYLFSKKFSYSFKSLYNSLEEPGDAVSAAQVPLVFISFRNNNRTTTFSVTEKFLGTITFDKEFLNFIDQGTLPFYGRNEFYGPFDFQSQYYREAALGISNQIWEGFSIGFRPKILFGKGYYQTSGLNISVETNNQAEELYITPEGEYILSGPFNAIYDPEMESAQVTLDFAFGDYFFNLRNLGLAFDFGLSAEIGDKSKITFSILDIGFIGLKYKTYDARYINPIIFAKDELYQSVDMNVPNYKEPKEALKDLFYSIPDITYSKEAADRLFVKLPAKLNITYKYNLTNTMQTGFSNQFTYIKNYSDNFLSGFIKTDVTNKFEAAATFNLYNFNKVFAGLGMSYTGKNIQCYISTNNIFRLIQPASAKNLNLCLGVNLLFHTEN